ncbi:acyl-CoA thioesterase [Saitoella coloradoensis]
MPSPIEENLELKEIDTNLYSNTKQLWTPMGARGIFGGAVIAQALSAAQKTVSPEYVVHSLHSYFLLPGDNSHPIIYHVERVRDGRSYATRTVQAQQRGRAIFTITCSFQRPEPSTMSHNTPIPPDLPDPETLMNDSDLLQAMVDADKLSESERKGLIKRMEPGPIESRRVPFRRWNKDLEPYQKRQRFWVKARGSIEAQTSHAMALAYFSDSWFVGTSVKVNEPIDGKVVMMASLDHSVYFHISDWRADEWLLYEMESSWSGGGRGFASGKIWRRDGVLVASCFQEGLVRVDHSNSKGKKRDAKI